MSQAPSREAVHLEDYRPPAYTTRDVHLAFALDPEATTVTATQQIERNPKAEGVADELVLFGEDQELLAVRLDGADLPPDRYRREADRLVLTGLPDRFELAVTSRHSPAANKRLMGLYISNGVYCTQCEAEGFRRITFFQDRPDVMARYRVRIEADRAAPGAALERQPAGAGEAEADATGRSGRTRSPSPPTCSRSWPATSRTSRTATRPAPAARSRCGSTPSPPTSTSATTPWRRSRRR